MDSNGSNNPNQPSDPLAPQAPSAAPSWDNSAPAADAGAPLPDPMSIAGAPPPAEAPAAQPPAAWPSSADPMTGTANGSVVSDPSQIPTAPQAPLDSNPFLQQPPAPAGMSEAPAAAPPISPTDPSQLGMPPEIPSAETGMTANPMQTPPAQDPLNTAFAPAQNPGQQSPFSAMPAADAGAPLPDPMSIAGAPPPAEAPAAQPPTGEAPAIPDFMNPNAQTEQPNPVENMGTGSGQGTNSNETANQAISSGTSFGESAGTTNAAGTIDLSAVQSTDTQAPAAPGSTPMTPQAPEGMPLPETGPVENAPTDLSHLIAGEGEHQTPGEIYTPPVAPDQNPTATQPQVPTQAGSDGAPPEKHLNLTKVLLIAGIPILLIVAALSAYLILGIGKPAPEPEPTPIPVQQTQAPLTNPPQQIADPSPVVLPSPTTSAVFEIPASGSATLPGSSPSPLSALEQLKARQSASPVASSSPSSTF